jgi:MFS family permease
MRSSAPAAGAGTTPSASPRLPLAGRHGQAFRSQKMLQWLRGAGAVPSWSGEGKSPSWHVLAQRRFLAYFLGSLVSNLGTWLQSTAQMLAVYQLTHSAFAVGVITCAQFCGFLVIGPWAGALGDWLGRKIMLLGTQIMSACVAGVLAYLQFRGMLTEQSLVIGALAMGLCFTFALPMQTTMAPCLVRKSDTKAAMAMNSVSYNAGRTLAPVLCVAVIASIGAGWAFALNAVSFAVFAVVILVVHPHSARRPVRLTQDWLGLRIAVREPRILLLLTMVAAVTLADDPVLVLGPSLARQVLAVSSLWPAYFLSVLGLGTVLGAMVPTKKTSSARLAAWPLLALALSVVLFTSGINAWLSLLAALLAGVAGLLTGAATQALLLEKAGSDPASVMALWAVAWAGSKPIASLTDGWLASNIGVRWAGLLLAAPAILIAVLELILTKDFKRRLKDFAYSHNGTRTLATSDPYGTFIPVRQLTDRLWSRSDWGWPRGRTPVSFRRSDG